MHQSCLEGDNDATTSKSRDKHLWLYIPFYKIYNNQTWWNASPACINLTGDDDVIITTSNNKH